MCCWHPGNRGQGRNLHLPMHNVALHHKRCFKQMPACWRGETLLWFTPGSDFLQRALVLRVAGSLLVFSVCQVKTDGVGAAGIHFPACHPTPRYWAPSNHLLATFPTSGHPSIIATTLHCWPCSNHLPCSPLLAASPSLTCHAPPPPLMATLQTLANSAEFYCTKGSSMFFI